MSKESKHIGPLALIRWDAEFLERVARFAKARKHHMVLYGIGLFGFYVCFLDGRRRKSLTLAEIRRIIEEETVSD